MAFITPKTDWTSEDFFNIEDYGRIVNNINVLIDASLAVIGVKIPYPDIPTSKDYTDMLRAEEFNEIENSLDTINKATLVLDIGEKKTYVANQPTFDYAELNRIESAILNIYTPMKWSYEAITHLPFRLGTPKGMRF